MRPYLFSIPLLLVACGGDGSGSESPIDGPIDGRTDLPIDAPATTDAAPEPEPPWDTRPPLTNGAWVRVRNRCSFPLWIHSAGSSGVLQPDDVRLAPGESRDYEAPANWSAARVTAYGDGPRTGELEKAEMTLSASGNLVSLNYNITYVDWVGLPLRVAGAGGECSDAQHAVSCNVPQAEVLSGCPSQLRAGDICLSPRSYCLNPVNQGQPFCHSLDGEIARCVSTIAGCAQHNGATTPEVFACSGSFANAPRLCAALNRHMLDAPDDPDPSHWYATAPYNTYSKWVHEVCPGIYAFSYDDWLEQGGFRSCRGTELRITFCPAG
ncbi:MAG TPA: beta-1,3-glucanase family protein [Kofleriaceae bacterium]|jgi:hypothetical protein|nr:beta-1,3-glucanase family protein [Kofleriaceae bacterium]